MLLKIKTRIAAVEHYGVKHQTFTFKRHCYFCVPFISGSEKRVIQVCTIFQESVMKAWNSSHEIWPANVQSPLLCQWITTAEVEYHEACSANFRKLDPIPQKCQEWNEWMNKCSKNIFWLKLWYPEKKGFLICYSYGSNSDIRLQEKK